MWTTLALAAALSLTPGQTDQLSFLNVRSVTGYFGPERQTNKLLPGDVYLLVFDIAGFKVDTQGKILYQMAMQVTDSRGKVQFGHEPQDREAYNSLGGNRVPASAFIEVRFDQPPGEYTLNITVTDRNSKASRKLAQKFEVLPKAFGLVQLVTTIDPQRGPAVPPMGVVGEFRFVNVAAVGFERDTVTKQPNLLFEMRILDESGKPVSRPATSEVGDKGEIQLPETAGIAHAQFPVALNRPGKFSIELQATDRISKKTAKLSLPLSSLEQPSGRSGTER
jgi:hypothetical protein